MNQDPIVWLGGEGRGGEGGGGMNEKGSEEERK